MSLSLCLMTDYTKNHGIELYARNAPGRYPMTAQQLKLRQVVEECGIVKGIRKADLMTKMRDCVGPRMRKQEG